MFKMALLGCGRIGKMHADIINSSVVGGLAAVYDVYQPAAQELADKYHCLCAASVEDAIAAADGVLIATSTPTHADLIEIAVKAGKAVFCEKPIDLSIERVKQARAAIGDSAKMVQIGFNRRFDPGHRAARTALENGDIGELQQVIISSRDPAAPPLDYVKVSGGIFRDMTIHDFDLARYMLGEDPVEVFATGSVLVDKAIGDCHDQDTIMIIMRTASGKQCHINNCRAASYGYDQRVELFGSKGMVISDNLTANNLRRYNKVETQAAPPLLDFYLERYQQAYSASLKSFIEAAIHKTPPEVNFEDGQKALALAEAAMVSLRDKRFVSVDY